jgi:hypothetical protein
VVAWRELEHDRTVLPQSKPTSHAWQLRIGCQLVDTINLYLVQHSSELKLWHAAARLQTLPQNLTARSLKRLTYLFGEPLAS